MKCPRCAAEMPQGNGGPWCTDCENQYDTWIRKHAADILWQTGSGALVAMAIGLGLPLLGVEPVIATIGVLAGASTFLGLRSWGKKRRRKQFLAGALPRAYLPSRTT
jgi:hypothetical protein